MTTGDGPLMLGSMLLSGDRYVLRPWRTGDEEALVRHANDRAVWRNLTDRFPHPYTRDAAVSWIRTVEEQGAPPRNFAIVVDREPIGGGGFDPLGDIHCKSAEIGYWLGRTHWGKDLATKVLKQLTEYAFATFDIERLQAHVFEWNPASGRVLEKAGYALEARHVKSVFKDGQLIDEYCHVRLRASRR
jgi:ribosomal-protein-alanine N-acetyltransferase